PGTGIQPFLPPKPLRSNESALRNLKTGFKNYVLGPPLAAVKLVLIAALGVVAAVLNGLGVVLIFAPIRRAWSVTINAVFFRTILFLFGFYWIDSSLSSTRKGWVVGVERRAWHLVGAASVRSGDIIVANHASYIDILYLAFRFSPTFLHISRNGRVRPITMWDALTSVGDYPVLDAAEDKLTLIEAADRAREGSGGPVVVFPEGTSSNGRGLLKFFPVFSAIEPEALKGRLVILALKYSYEEFCPSFTVGNRLSHVFWLLCQFSNDLQVKQLPPDEVTLSATARDAGSFNMEEGVVGSQIGTLLGHMFRHRKTGMGAKDKQDFLDYYLERTAGQRRKGRKGE
ncbi:hypothetical protein BDK51DRAFT_23060, partial [Blyttiomyces helicus]